MAETRSIRGITDEDWTRIQSAAARRGMKIGDYIVYAHVQTEGIAQDVEEVVSEIQQQVQRQIFSRPTRFEEHGTTFECKAEDCDFRSKVLRPCPAHPNAGLRRAW